MTETFGKRSRQTLVGWLTVLLAAVALLAWAFASPVGASPDDDYHLASIWCGEGLREGLCEAAPLPTERSVPQSLADSACYAFDANESAACQSVGFTSASDNQVTTDRGNFQGDYPPVFYAVMGLFAGSDLSLSVLVMRLFNTVLFLGLAAAIYRLIPQNRRPAMVWSLAITVVPLGMFLIPSVNPSSWAIISAGTLWVALLGFFETQGWRKAVLGGLAAVAVVMGAGARADAAMYAILAAVAVSCFSYRRSRRFLLSAILPLSIVVVATVFYLSSNQSSAASSGFENTTTAPPGLGHLLFVNLLEVPALWAGALGFWNLGWLDTSLPAIVWVATLGAFAALCFAGLRHANWRKTLALVGVLAAAWLVPAFVLVQSAVFVGSQVQPRYILPILMILAGISLLQSKGDVLRLGRVQAVFLVASLSIANAVALHFNIRRYVNGLDVSGWNLDSSIEWWWGIPLSPMTLWAIGSIAFSGLLWLVFKDSFSSQNRNQLREAPDLDRSPSAALHSEPLHESAAKSR